MSTRWPVLVDLDRPPFARVPNRDRFPDVDRIGCSAGGRPEGAGREEAHHESGC